ncbi:MAG: DNRLRE domain-containing protein [Polyangiales bacterium]
MKRGGHLLVGTLTLALAARDAGAWRLEDSLRGSTRGNPVGGAVTAEGWRVTGRTDRLWYAIPRLVRGSVEFTVTHLTMSSLGDTSDNELFAMYEAGYGIAEPIAYSAFRENHYKCMLRIYANGEVGRAGQQKLMWGMCPGGAPGFGACACDRSFFEEPFGGNGAWDGSAQRLRIEWGDGVTRYLRNGTAVVSIDWSRSGLAFGPSALHVSLGTSRPSAVDTAQLPVGIVFSDLIIDGTEGPAATCEQPVTDAGMSAPDVGTSTVDAGSVAPGVVEIPAVEDVTVDPTHAATVFPDERDLSVGAGDSEFYVKFRVPALAGRVVRAQLVLRSGAYPSAVGTGASVFAAARDDWSERTLTWNARPGPRGARLARLDGVAEDTAYALDLPRETISAAGTYAFAVLPEAGDANSAHFDARERAPGRGPVLRLTVEPTVAPPDAGVATLDAPSGNDVAPPADIVRASDLGRAVDAPTVPDVPAPRDAGRGDAAGGTGTDAPVQGSCGCRAADPPRVASPLALCLAALATRRRRRR